MADRKAWLARIGFEMQLQRSKKQGTSKPENSEIYASGDMVRTWVEAAMQESTPKNSHPDAEAFVEYLGKRTGLLFPRGEEKFSFLHLSFQEYFAALYIREQIISPEWATPFSPKVDHRTQRNSLQKYAQTDAWNETLVFLVELVAAEQSKWLSKVQDAIFGENFDDINPEKFLSINSHIATWFAKIQGKSKKIDDKRNAAQQQASLLAKMATDPHAGFTEETSNLILERCCFWAANEQHNIGDLYPTRPLLEYIISYDTAQSDYYFSRLCHYAQRIGIENMNLNGISEINNIDSLSSVKSLKRLHIHNINPIDISPLKELKNLKKLDIATPKVRNITPLSKIKSLEYLIIIATPIGNGDTLTDLTELKTLWVFECNTTSIDFVINLTKLESFHIKQKPPVSLTALSSLENLRSFSCIGMPLEDFPELIKIPSIQNLNLKGTQLKNLNTIASIENLASLIIDDTSVNDLTPLLECANSLHTISIKNCPITPEHMHEFISAWKIKTHRELEIKL